MKKTLKSIRLLTLVGLCAATLAGCTKDTFINSIKDTYTVQTDGSEKYFDRETGRVWQILASEGSVKYYIRPEVYMMTNVGDVPPVVSAASDEYVRNVKREMDAYGYTSVDTEDQADIVINITNLRLRSSIVVWSPSPWLDPYFNFWGGYHPWWQPVYISYYTNKVLFEAVDAQSLVAYRDWYQNTWKPQNPNKYPQPGNVPEDKRPLMVWKGDICGEMSEKGNSENDAYVFNLIPQAFGQSAYMDIN